MLARTQRGPAASGGERAVAVAVRRAGIRAPHHPGRPAVLQRAARGRSAAAGLRPSYRGAAGEPRQGADVARRLGGAGARARSGGARKRRRDPADDASRARIIVESGRAAGIETARRRSRSAPGISSPPRSTRIRRFSICSTTRWCRERCASRRSASSTICWRRCSRSISTCASRRATARARDHPAACAGVHGDPGARSCRPVRRRSCATTRPAPSRRR